MRLWAVIPAAGVGRRMGGGQPKQYRELLGRPVIEWVIERLLGHSRVAGAVVAVAAHDPYWDRLDFATTKPVKRVDGGAERQDSVLAALDHVVEVGGDDDWALVHDAVRPCLSEEELDRLISLGTSNDHGALLAKPVADTLKRSEGSQVAATVPRDSLWQAQTPQLFPVVLLREGLGDARSAGVRVTDEAQAVERLGGKPLLVPGDPANLKITQPEDFDLAAAILKSRRDSHGEEL
ncbi:2-C-methyl-D-erythritol 4-phosphate cytidylyltransferase [Halorhodospira halochloris]|uniref:2-C-methyl-D-erythritol 4-phosphate cytidylyltransferase n=1 Tax=Halorhodospira halochloris TaxID=1052 RepID=UPI0023791F59|nr:2-C-methyl-D-erythritol 4-phosphate cytidylyltransferase [Halorhodospira halochloris]